MKPTDKFTYSIDNDEVYDGTFCDTREEALQCALDEIKFEIQDSKEFGGDLKESDFDIIRTGRVMQFVPYIDAEYVIEKLQNQAYDEAGEFTFDWLDKLNSESVKKLSDMLTETFNKWARVTNNKPNFYTVEEIQEHKVEMME